MLAGQGAGKLKEGEELLLLSAINKVIVHCRLALSWEKAGTITMGLTGQESQSETLMRHRLDNVWPNSRFHLSIKDLYGDHFDHPINNF